jgi:hypothetical protein
MVVVRSPFPSTVGSTDARARRRRLLTGFLLAGSLGLNAYLLLRGESPRPAPPPASASATPPGDADVTNAEPALAEDERFVFEPKRESSAVDAELVRLRERLVPFEKMAPGDAIVFSGRDFGWILRSLWELPPNERTKGIARLAGELKRRQDGKDLVLGALFSEEDPRALSALAAVLATTDYTHKPVGSSEHVFSTDVASMARIVDTLRAGEPADRRVVAARAIGDFVVYEDALREQAEALVSILSQVRDSRVAEALGDSFRENGHFTQHPGIRDSLLELSKSVDRPARRALLLAYGDAANSWGSGAKSLAALWESETDPERRQDLAYAFARADLFSNPPELWKVAEPVRARHRARLLAAYRESSEIETRRALAAQALRTGATGSGPERAAFFAALIATEPDASYRARLEAAAGRLGRGETFDAVEFLYAPE